MIVWFDAREPCLYELTLSSPVYFRKTVFGDLHTEAPSKGPPSCHLVLASCLTETLHHLDPSFCRTLSPLSSSLSSSCGGEGVVELFKRDDAVAIVVESSHKSVLFVVAQVDVHSIFIGIVG